VGGRPDGPARRAAVASNRTWKSSDPAVRRSTTEAVTVTTQSPHLYERQQRRAAGAPGTDRGAGRPAEPQTRLPWWALALPVTAFAVLLALLGGGSAQASATASGGDLFARLASLLGALLHHVG
jgi:hypothetical protein